MPSIQLCFPPAPLLCTSSTGFLPLGNPLQVLSATSHSLQIGKDSVQKSVLYIPGCSMLGRWGWEGRAWHSILSPPLAALFLHTQTARQQLVSGYLGTLISHQCQGSINSIGSSPSLKYLSFCRPQGGVKLFSPSPGNKEGMGGV